MTSQLSDAFFGNKKLTEQIYSEHVANSSKRLPEALIFQIFQPYTTKLQSIRSQTQNLRLLDLFVEFMQQVSQKFIKWQFQKYSSVMQIAAHVFEWSFEQWLTKQQSYKYFSDVIVRHSLFRPPHSVCVFEYEQMKEVVQFWVEHFLRFYEEFEECFKSSLNEKIDTVVFPQRLDKQQDLKNGKVIGKEAVANFL